MEQIIKIEKKDVNFELLRTMGAIRDMIFMGRLATMRDINMECRKYHEGLKLWEQEWLHGEMLSYYIIHCEQLGKVPVSGYRD